MLILPQNKLAVLVDEIYYSEFDAELSQHPEIQTVFIVTDSETAYRSMIRTYDGKDCYAEAEKSTNSVTGRIKVETMGFHTCSVRARS